MTSLTLPDITDQTALHRAWRTLMGPLGFSRASLWVFLVDADDRPIPALTTIDDLPRLPTTGPLADLIRSLRDVSPPGARLAFLLSRPGRDGLTAADRAWAGALHDQSRRAGLACETVHRANDVDLVPIPLDELPSLR